MRDSQGAVTTVLRSLRPLFSFAWRTLLVLTICRLIFVMWQWQRVIEADMLTPILVEGLRFDLVLMGLMLAVPVLVFPLLASNRLLIPCWRGLLKTVLPMVLLIVVFMQCSTPSFVDQLDSRPNIFMLEYLNKPREVAAMLWTVYKFPILVSVGLAMVLTWVNVRQIGRLVNSVRPIGAMPAILVTPFLLIVCLAMVGSAPDQYPVNPGIVAVSSDPLLNDSPPGPKHTAVAGRLSYRPARASERPDTQAEGFLSSEPLTVSGSEILD